MTQEKVFIIIINFNGWPDTKECLESLGCVNYDNFEVILIDNGSVGDYRLQAADYRFKIHEIYNKENLGFAGANNQGIELALEAEADYVLLLNNDTAVEADFLTKLVAEAGEDESVGIAGPLIYFYDSQPADNGKKLIWSAGGKITNNFTRGELIAHKEIDEDEYRTPEQVDYISGTCLLIKSEVIKKIGLISENYFLYYEDADWCLRVARAGWRSILVPQAKIYHKVSKSTQEGSYPYIYYHSRNGLMFGEQFGNKPIVYLMSIWIFFKQVVKIVVGYKRSWARPILRAVFDFWCGRKGKLKGYY